jgi:hypothetical protein
MCRNQQQYDGCSCGLYFSIFISSSYSDLANGRLQVLRYWPNCMLLSSIIQTLKAADTMITENLAIT